MLIPPAMIGRIQSAELHMHKPVYGLVETAVPVGLALERGILVIGFIYKETMYRYKRSWSVDVDVAANKHSTSS